MSALTRLHIDFETASELDLLKVGSSRYARHPSTRVLLCAFAFGDEDVEQWVPAYGDPMPERLRLALTDPQYVKIAWNKSFEWNILLHVLGIRVPHDQWRDTMVLAYTLSLPGSLGAAGTVVELPEDKKKSARGKVLIRKFCAPRTPTKTKPWRWNTAKTDPADWQEFCEYNIGDVVAEREIWKRLRRWNLPHHEWELWFLDQEINEAGVPIRLPVVHNAIQVAADVTQTRLARMSAITGLANPNSGKQLLPWLQDHGYWFDDLKKGHVARALERIEAEDDEARALMGYAPVQEIRAVLQLRQEVSKSSVKKFVALDEATDDDGFLRNTTQFAGAGRTWRWAGRKFQVQNLARPVRELEKPEQQVLAVQHLEMLDTEAIELLYPKPMDLLSSCVRPVVQAPEGMTLLDADLNAIENRVLGWLAGDEKILNVFRNKRDPYIDFATYMYGADYETLWAEYKAGDKAKRTVSKPGVLGCGYMLGPGAEFENDQTGEIEATGLLGYAWNMGVRLTKEQSAHSVKVWRDTFRDCVEFWWAIDKAARRCIQTSQPQECGYIRFDRSGPFMRMILPSGRALHYCRPRIEDRMKPWGEVGPTITYEGLNDKNQWARLTTHPGKLTENADQAIARDLLAHGMQLARRRGLDIRLHVHDQVVAMAPIANAERQLELLIECMSEEPSWAPGLPLAAEGHISPYFVKD